MDTDIDIIRRIVKQCIEVYGTETVALALQGLCTNKVDPSLSEWNNFALTEAQEMYDHSESQKANRMERNNARIKLIRKSENDN